MNKITVDGVEFVKTKEIYPVENGVFYKNKWYTSISYKAGDWVIFSEKNIVRRIVLNISYADILGGSATLYNTFKEWMTEGAAIRWKQEIKRKATESEIKQHLAKMAVEKGLIKGVKVKRFDDTTDNKTFVTIVQEDDAYYLEQDEYCKSGIILYSKGQWVTKIEETKFTFGGHEVTFKKTKSAHFNTVNTIEINCKGETGTHHEIINILSHYFRPMSFGKVSVKKFTVKNASYTNLVDGYNVNCANDDVNIIDTITIGCLTGKYSELVAIFQECQKLLK